MDTGSGSHTIKASNEELAANEALGEALKALNRAGEFCKRAGYGSLVVGSVAAAMRETQYALDTALGRN